MFRPILSVAAVVATTLVAGAYAVSLVLADEVEEQAVGQQPSAEEMQKMMQAWQATM